MNIYDKAQQYGGRIVFFAGSGLSTSSVQVTDDENHLINYSCAALKIKNLSTDANLKFSFDNSHWQELAYLEEVELIKNFDTLYVKMATGSTGQYQGMVIKLQ